MGVGRNTSSARRETGRGLLQWLRRGSTNGLTLLFFMWSNFRTSAKAICQAVAAEKFRRVFVAHLRSSASTLPQIALALAFERDGKAFCEVAFGDDPGHRIHHGWVHRA